MANLQASWSQVPEAWSIKLTFSLIVTCYLTKLESKTKKSLTDSSHTIALRKGAIFTKKCYFSQKNDDTSKIKVGLVHLDMFSDANHVYALNLKLLG